VKKQNKMIILFDGVCNLCNGLVNFVIDRDPSKKFMFTSLQSEIGKEILKKYKLPINDLDSFILIVGNTYYRKSTASLIVAKHLNGFCKYFYPLIIIPEFIRNFFYDLIAKNRYVLFGKRSVCRLPEPAIQERFLV
jgi:predicted DCC family thiol-disulfide oxidoreductase YuxK